MSLLSLNGQGILLIVCSKYGSFIAYLQALRNAALFQVFSVPSFYTTQPTPYLSEHI